MNPDTFKGGLLTITDSNGVTRIDWATFLAGDAGNTSQIDGLLRQYLTGQQYGTELMLRKYLMNLRALMAKGYKLPNGYTQDDVNYAEQQLR
jgi:hypothetical protein